MEGKNAVKSVIRVATDSAPEPAGHYCQATAWNDLIFVSGQLATSADGEQNADKPFETQVRQALGNILAIVREAGSDPEHVLRITAYIVGVENWPVFNQVYAEIFGDIRPARAVVPVPELHLGYSIELEAIAVRRPVQA